jgi:hypothetical protein
MSPRDNAHLYASHVPLEEVLRKERSRDRGDRDIEECSHGAEELDWIDQKITMDRL